jgi:alpha-tubulin suppressor-like RCC1 family protein
MGTTGVEDTDIRYTPTLLELFTGNGQKQEVIDVALGLEHTLVLVSGGRVFRVRQQPVRAARRRHER